VRDEDGTPGDSSVGIPQEQCGEAHRMVVYHISLSENVITDTTEAVSEMGFVGGWPTLVAGLRISNPPQTQNGHPEGWPLWFRLP
jgi:hypothetical protein